MRTEELIIYRDTEEGSILSDMAFLTEGAKVDALKERLFSCVEKLLDMAVSHGFEGNIWHNYLAYYLASHENAYSTSCEIVGEVEGSINTAALCDFAAFKELFDFDFAGLMEKLGMRRLSFLSDYTGIHGHGKVFNKRIRDRICELGRHLGSAADAEEFKSVMTRFYQEFLAKRIMMTTN